MFFEARLLDNSHFTRLNVLFYLCTFLTVLRGALRRSPVAKLYKKYVIILRGSGRILCFALFFFLGFLSLYDDIVFLCTVYCTCKKCLCAAKDGRKIIYNRNVVVVVRTRRRLWAPAVSRVFSTSLILSLSFSLCFVVIIIIHVYYYYNVHTTAGCCVRPGGGWGGVGSAADDILRCTRATDWRPTKLEKKNPRQRLITSGGGDDHTVNNNRRRGLITSKNYSASGTMEECKVFFMKIPEYFLSEKKKFNAEISVSKHGRCKVFDVWEENCWKVAGKKQTDHLIKVDYAVAIILGGLIQQKRRRIGAT